MGQRVRVGIIGLGTMGSYLYETLKGSISGAEVVALASRAEEHREPPRLTHGSGLELIDDPSVDAVVVATPDETHEQFVLAGLAAGKPVFCEKPLAPTANACRKIVEAEVATGRHLVQVGYMRRYDPAYQTLKRSLDDRAAGSPLVLHSAHRAPGPSKNKTTDLLMSNAAVHDIDAARWLLGEEITSAAVFMPPDNRVARNAFDPMIIILRTESGVVIDHELFVNVGYGCDILAELVCERGTLALAPSVEIVSRIAGNAASPVAQSTFKRFGTAYRIEVQSWIDGIREGQACSPSAWDGYCATAVSDACRESVATGLAATVRLHARPSFYS